MQTLRYVAVALLAGTVGAVTALLLAPDSGEATRRRIGKGIDRQRRRLAKRGRAALHDAGEFIEDQVDTGRKALEAQVKEGRRSIGRLVG